MNRYKKIWSIVLILTMLFSLFPASAFALELVPLDAPTNLTWNVNADGRVEAGYISWDTVENGTGRYQVNVYKDGELYKLPNGYLSKISYTGLYQDTAYVNIKDFFYESGTYTFSVYAQGDGWSSSNGAAATSDTFVYVRPSAELGETTDLKWVNTTRCWKAVKGADMYEIKYYKDGNAVGTSTMKAKNLSQDGEWVYTNNEWLFDLIERPQNGNGNYSFTVQAISKDIAQTANGLVSAMSPVTNIGSVAEYMRDMLDNLNMDIAAGTMSATEARSELVKENIADLTAAFNGSRTAVNYMTELEEAYKEEQGITVDIYVTEEAAAAGVASNIKIKGAALNTEVANDEVTFNISKTKNRNLTDNGPTYKNMMLMDMNLSGEGINPDGSLSVPVSVKMPVPADISQPAQFRVLHLLNNSGEYELIVPTIAKESSGYYATFVLSHLGQFAFAEAMTQEEVENLADSPDLDAALKGDVNLDSEVNMDDVVALLNHVVKAEIIVDSAALAAGEVTNDVELNMDDVVKLLNYVVKAIDSLD